jgi:hypothetical protein
MIRRLHERLGISAGVLIRPAGHLSMGLHSWIFERLQKAYALAYRMKNWPIRSGFRRYRQAGAIAPRGQGASIAPG